MKVLWRSLNRWCRIGSHASPKCRTITRISCANSPVPSSVSKTPPATTSHSGTQIRSHQWALVRISWVRSSWDHRLIKSCKAAAFSRCASSAGHWSTRRRSPIRVLRRPRHRGNTRPFSSWSHRTAFLPQTYRRHRSAKWHRLREIMSGLRPGSWRQWSNHGPLPSIYRR